jgi:2,3-bisphosphoglycerate-independent phosphoglycerate mutase
MASTPTWDGLWSRGSRTLLQASGLPVGLPEGQMGNSEVGHLNLGAGRVVMQDMVRISESIRDGTFFRNRHFVAACETAKKSGGTLHLMGLIGKGGVHALDRHLFALIDLAERQGVGRVAIHALLDGRDTLPKSALEYMRETVAAAQGRARIASLGGRYFGMDRDRRWQRTQLWYDAAIRGVGPTAPSARPTRTARPTSSSRPRSWSARTGSPSRRSARATRSSASTSARTACARWCARSPTRSSTASTWPTSRASPW